MPSDRGGPERDAPEARTNDPERRRSATVGDAAGRDRLPRPSWIPTDGVIAPSRDRQVLVVGTTPTGLTVAGLLRAAGYDPVLARGAETPSPSRVTYLPPAAVEVMGALDLGRRVVDRGRRVTRATVRLAGGDGERHGNSGGSESLDRAPPVVVPTPALCRILRDGIDSAAVADGRAVGGLAPGDDGVAATFDDGVEECFDLAVDACGATTGGLQVESGVGRQSIARYEAVRPTSAERSAIEEVWGPAVAVQRLPGPGERRELVRITTSETEASVDEIRRRVAADGRVSVARPDPDSFDRVPSEFAPLPERRLPGWWWGRGRIARCGPAACPAAPAAGMGSALGITDALGVVRALVRTESAVPAAVDGYSDRRARRLAHLRDAATADRTVAAPASPESWLGSVYALRSIGLQPFFGSASTALPTGGEP